MPLEDDADPCELIAEGKDPDGRVWVETREGYCTMCLEETLDHLWFNYRLTIADDTDQPERLMADGAIRIYLTEEGGAA